MKNKLRISLLSNVIEPHKGALKAVEVLERYSAADLEYFIIKQLYKDTSMPYEYIKTKGPINALKLESKLQTLIDLPLGYEITKWLLNYCQTRNDFQEIRFDTMPIDQFLSFAEIFNETLYDDINALLSFENEAESKEFWRDEYGELEIHKHVHALGNIEDVIANLRKTSYVLETYKKNRALFTNITYMPRSRTTVCHARLSSLTKRHPEWFAQSISVKKSERYEGLVQRYPIEIKAFEEILSGERSYYIRTDEPDYTTPPLKTYGFTRTTFCYFSELGQTIYRELKEELSRKVSNNHEAKRTGLLKTDMEEMRHAPNYSETLEAMRKKDVVAVAQKVSVANIFPDCVTLLCEDVHVKTESGWDTSEATLTQMVVEIDTHINLDILNRIHHQGITLYGSIEYQLGDGGSELGLHVKSFSIVI